MRLVINGIKQGLLALAKAEELLASSTAKDDLEIWASHENEASLCAPMNSRCGWLMFLRFNGDVGFRSRSRTKGENESDVEQFVLANGQADSYPKSRTFERKPIIDAILEFVLSGKKPSSVDWHDDSAT
ncbi:Imm1 family immunity protein [uncultured Tateyamaria sp.]|uniref:Imm1 family immunity protein n=1 Tax=uncultured Tateyamaria sp. TaxID=455651 RepID=UPI002613A5EB|nr:Imm1 family immunity protein [uncultured Tateyamaria sp.]